MACRPTDALAPGSDAIVPEPGDLRGPDRRREPAHGVRPGRHPSVLHGHRLPQAPSALGGGAGVHRRVQHRSAPGPSPDRALLRATPSRRHRPIRRHVAFGAFSWTSPPRASWSGAPSSSPHSCGDSATDWGMGILVIEHDIRFVMTACDFVMALDFGREIAVGSPEAVRHDPAVVAAYLGDVEEVRPAEPGTHGALRPGPNRLGRISRERIPGGRGDDEHTNRRDGWFGARVTAGAEGLAAGYGHVPAIEDVDLHDRSRRGGGDPRVRTPRGSRRR